MKALLHIVLFLCVGVASAQQENVIKIYVSTNGGHNVTRLSYYDLTDIMEFETLTAGKHKFYIKVDDSCVISLSAERSPKLNANETSRFNEYFAKYKVEYYDNDVLITDCSKFSSQSFPITITKLR